MRGVQVCIGLGLWALAAGCSDGGDDGAGGAASDTGGAPAAGSGGAPATGGGGATGGLAGTGGAVTGGAGTGGDLGTGGVAATGGGVPVAGGWRNVQIWGGGYVPGVAFHPSAPGLAYARTDVGGSYRLDAGGTSWTPLNDAFTDANDMGSLAIGLDAADPEVVYATGGLYTDLAWCGGGSFLRSGDRGASWTKIPLTNANVAGTAAASLTGAAGDASRSLCLGGNGAGRGAGPRIAASGDTVYLATNQNGLLRSVDRGYTWTTVAAFDNTSGVAAVFFDADGDVYAAPYAGGLLASDDGVAWVPVAGVTAAVYQAAYSPDDDRIWLTTNSGNPLDQNAVSGGSLVSIAADRATVTTVTTLPVKPKDYGFLGVAVNPSDGDQVLVSTGAWWRGVDGVDAPESFVPHEALFMTMDGGATWADLLGDGTFDAATAHSSASSNPHWLSAVAVDPADPDHVIFGTGYGVWSTFDATAAAPTWVFTDEGIEETVPLALVSTTYGAPLVSALGDIDGFYHADLHAPPDERLKLGDGSSEAGTNFDLDHAPGRPGYLVRVHKHVETHLGAWSSDGGLTWTDFGSHPPYVEGEQNFIAVSSDGETLVWNMLTHGVYTSDDDGLTWTPSATPAANLAGFRVVADRVTPGTFYIYNAASGTLYRSEDSGSTWAPANATLEYADDWAWGYFRAFASPDAAGELWLTQGAHLYPCVDATCPWPEYEGAGLWVGDRGDGNVLLRSRDGGVTTEPVAGILSARYVGFGKGTGATSAIYVLGLAASGVEGVFRSVDDGATWARIDDPARQFGGLRSVVGDPCIFSRLYAATSGRGIVMYDEPSALLPSVSGACPDRVD